MTITKIPILQKSVPMKHHHWNLKFTNIILIINFIAGSLWPPTIWNFHKPAFKVRFPPIQISGGKTPKTSTQRCRANAASKKQQRGKPNSIQSATRRRRQETIFSLANSNSCTISFWSSWKFTSEFALVCFQSWHLLQFCNFPDISALLFGSSTCFFFFFLSDGSY